MQLPQDSDVALHFSADLDLIAAAENNPMINRGLAPETTASGNQE